MLLARLDTLGLAEDTLLIAIGDHGACFTRGKTSCYESGLRIPFVVRWPGRAAEGHVSDAMISTVDILPTVLEAAGVELPRPVAGESLVPHVTGNGAPSRRYLCGEYASHHEGGYFPRRAVRDRRYKLIHNLLPGRENPIKGVDGCAAWGESRDPSLDGTHIRHVYDTYARPPEFELYDLANDPVEFHDLHEEAAHADALLRLQAALLDWRQETGDPLLDPAELERLTRVHDEGTIGQGHPNPAGDGPAWRR
jgi:N-sulfoglucosamine sulfohydrolase